MAQVPALIVKPHVPAASSHVSVVHGRPSEHVESVTQIALPLHTPHPDVVPSLQRFPIRAVHDVGLATGSHHRHALPAFTVMAP